jgi:hypothetical protein
LHHDQAPIPALERGQQVKQHRNGHVVGQIGHDRGRRRGQLSDLQSVAGDHGEPSRSVGRALRNGSRKPGGEHGVDLHRHHAGTDLEQAEGQRSESRTDLQDGVLGAHAGRGDDPPDGVGVGDEVLST